MQKKVASHSKRGFKWAAAGVGFVVAGVGLVAGVATILAYLNIEVVPAANPTVAVTDAYELFALPP